MNKDIILFLEQLKERPEVLGVILFGSWARGNNRADSDIDLVVILTEGYRRTVEYRNKQAFEIIYTTKEKALEYWQNHKDDAAGLWEVAKILYDKDGGIELLQNRVKEILSLGKEPIDDYQIGQYRFDAEDQLKYLESILDSDKTSANFILSNKIFALSELFFDIRQMWTPPPKQRLAKIKVINPEFYELLRQFYKENTPLTEKLDLAKKMIPRIFEK